MVTLGDNDDRPRGEVLAGFVAVSLGQLWQAWMIVRLWAWFAVPLGLRPLVFSQAVAAGVLIVMLRRRGGKIGKDHLVMQAFGVYGADTLNFLIAAVVRAVFGG